MLTLGLAPLLLSAQHGAKSRHFSFTYRNEIGRVEKFNNKGKLLVTVKRQDKMGRHTAVALNPDSRNGYTLLCEAVGERILINLKMLEWASPTDEKRAKFKIRKRDINNDVFPCTFLSWEKNKMLALGKDESQDIGINIYQQGNCKLTLRYFIKNVGVQEEQEGNIAGEELDFVFTEVIKTFFNSKKKLRYL
jgi:hypothetical protein